MKTISFFMGLIYFSILIIIIPLSSCENCYRETKYYENAKLIDIRRDDDAQIHVMLEYKSGQVVQYHDISSYSIFRSDSGYYAKVPMFKWKSCNGDEGINNTFDNTSGMDFRKLEIYIPKSYEITFFVD